MQNFINKISKPAKLIAIICFLVTAVFHLIGYISGFPDAFMPVIAHLFNMFFWVALLAIIPLLLLLKKDKEARLIISAFACYWALTIINELMGLAEIIRSEAPALMVIAGIFALIAALGLMVVVVFMVLSLVLGLNLKGLSRFILVCTFGAFFFTFLFVFIYYVSIDGGGDVILTMLIDLLVMPTAVIFSILYLDSSNASN